MAIERKHELDERPQSRREWSGWLRSIVLPVGLVAAMLGGLVWFQARDSQHGRQRIRHR